MYVDLKSSAEHNAVTMNSYDLCQFWILVITLLMI